MTVTAHPEPGFPMLAGRVLGIGGLQVLYRDAEEALACLKAHRGIMVRQPLAAAGNPLAACDYHAAAAPYRARYLGLPGGGRGAAGRHLTKSAFLDALEDALAAARAQEPLRQHGAAIDAAAAALASDFSLASAIADAAVAQQRARWQQRQRRQLRQAAHQAVSACEARCGQFSCLVQSACGTGGCRFAAGLLREVTSPAPAGRVARPANHRSTQGFSLASAEEELAARDPFRVCLLVSDGDTGSLADTVPQ